MATAAAGAPSSAARNPDLPAPPDDTCQRFHFTRGACPEKCPPWPCASAATHNFLGENWCHFLGMDQDCVSGFDCAAAEADVTGGSLMSCLALDLPCVVDADCPADYPYCVVDDARYTSGSCSIGNPNERCRADDDCRPGSWCVALDADGTRGCSDGRETGACNLDAECKGQRCIHEPGTAIDGLNAEPKPALAGVCATGEPGSLCFSGEVSCPPNTTCSAGVNDGTCLGDARCLRIPSSSRTPPGTLCSSGNVGDPCAQDSDCKSAHCPRRVDSVCTEGAPGDPCGSGADCESGFCAPPPAGPWEGSSLCSSGELGASCGSDAGCKSGHCTPAPANSPFRQTCSGGP